MKTKQNLIVALDKVSADRALEIADQLSGQVWGFKVNDLLVKEGPSIIKKLKAHGRVFADPKLHDIPNTVANSVSVLESAGADLITVHSSGGPSMLEAAVKSCGQSKILAVTVLTSLSPEECQSVYLKKPDRLVPDFVKLARDSGVAGIVCSPMEIESVRSLVPQDFIVLTPGIRPGWYQKADDQSRTSTPSAALEAGSNFLVIGRPICEDSDPLAAVKKIEAELS